MPHPAKYRVSAVFSERPDCALRTYLTDDWDAAAFLARSCLMREGRSVRIDDLVTHRHSTLSHDEYAAQGCMSPKADFPLNPWNLGAQWVNCGDADFLDYGGAQVRRSSMEGCYDVVLAYELPYGEPDRETHMFAGQTTIDAEDWFDDSFLEAALEGHDDFVAIAERAESLGLIELSMTAFGEEGAWAGYSMSLDAYAVDKLTLGRSLSQMGIDVAEGLERYEGIEAGDRDKYQLLSRLESDCKYYLGACAENGCDMYVAQKHLWADSVEKQISKMRELHDETFFKPKWLAGTDIDRYEKDMLALRDADPAANLSRTADRVMSFVGNCPASHLSLPEALSSLASAQEARGMILRDPEGLIGLLGEARDAMPTFSSECLHLASEAGALMRDVEILAVSSPIDSAAFDAARGETPGPRAPSLMHAEERTQ